MRNPSSSSSLSAPANLQKKSSGGGGKMGLKRGPWTTEEDELLTRCISKEGEGKWRTLPTRAGLVRCGKSCRLRWMNYLRPSVKRGQIAPDEEDLILRLHRLLGNRWSLIAGRIPGRTDNEIKNYWNTHMSKKLISQGIDPKTHKPLLETSKSGKKSDSDNSGSSKMVNETHDHQSNAPTSSGQNPNLHHHHQQQQQQYCSGSAADEGFWNASDGAEAGGYSDGYGYDHTSMNLADGAGGYHANLHQRSSQGLSDEDGGGGGGGGHGISCEGLVEDNEVFSSFLNSLINDDMFV